MPQIPFSLWFKKSSEPKCQQITLEDIDRKLTKIMTTLDDILLKVAAEKGIEDSIVQLLSNVRQQLIDVLAGGLTVAQQAKVDQIFTALDTNSAALSKAITDNQPPNTSAPVASTTT